MTSQLYLVAVATCALGACGVRFLQPLVARSVCSFVSLVALVTCTLPLLLETGGDVFPGGAVWASLASTLIFLNLLAIPKTKFIKAGESSVLSVNLLLQATSIAASFSPNVTHLQWLFTLESFLPLLSPRLLPRGYLLFPMAHVIFLLVTLAENLSGTGEWIQLLQTGLILARLGIFPLHGQLARLARNYGLSLVLPMLLCPTPVLLLLHSGLPLVTTWIYQAIWDLFLLMGLVYFASLSLVQRDARMFWTYMVMGIHSLVLLGLSLHEPEAITASLHYYLGTWLTLGGLGLVLRSLEARYGRLDLRQFQGLHASSPILGFGFLIFGIGSTAFPGFVTFLPLEILLDAALDHSMIIGLLALLALATISSANLWVYFRIFSGPRQASGEIFRIKKRELTVLWILMPLSILGPFIPGADMHLTQSQVQKILKAHLKGAAH